MGRFKRAAGLQLGPLLHTGLVVLSGTFEEEGLNVRFFTENPKHFRNYDILFHYMMYDIKMIEMYFVRMKYLNIHLDFCDPIIVRSEMT